MLPAVISVATAVRLDYRLLKSCYEVHTMCTKCRGQVCSRKSTCSECKDWGDDCSWKRFESHLIKLEKHRLKEAAARTVSRVSLSRDSSPKPKQDSSLALPSTPGHTLSPILSPPSLPPPTPMPSSRASDPSAISSLEYRIKSKFNKKINLVVNSV